MLTHEQIKFLRATKNSIVTLLLLHLLDRPTGETELACFLGCSTRTARQQLASLEKLGFAFRLSRYSGYTLTDYARHLKLFDPSGRLFQLGNESPPLPDASMESK
jgi:biotin operon repressor